MKTVFRLVRIVCIFGLGVLLGFIVVTVQFPLPFPGGAGVSPTEMAAKMAAFSGGE